jgi:hypothetical protein
MCTGHRYTRFLECHFCFFSYDFVALFFKIISHFKYALNISNAICILRISLWFLRYSLTLQNKTNLELYFDKQFLTFTFLDIIILAVVCTNTNFNLINMMLSEIYNSTTTYNPYFHGYTVFKNFRLLSKHKNFD